MLKIFFRKSVALFVGLSITLLLMIFLGASSFLGQSAAMPQIMSEGLSHGDAYIPDTANIEISPIYRPSAYTSTLLFTHTLFLPAILKDNNPTAKLGVDFAFLTSDPELLEYDLSPAREMGADWVRIWLPWPQVESSPGQYDWEKTDQEIEKLKTAGFKLLLVVYGAPEWAAELDCGPISNLAAFETFLEAVINRYGPDIDAWEFTNEPDGQEPHVWSPVIGCWGPYPAEYAAQLGIFHHKIKLLDPGAPVLFGGLAYDNWTIFDRSFFDQTLQHGAGQFFDIVSLHYYPINPVDFPTMAHKVNEIRETMTKHGVSGKEVWITETGMWVNANGSLDQQRNFIVQESTRGFCNGVDNIFWFAVRQEPVEPPLHRWLINLQHEPANAYYTFQNFADKIVGTICIGPSQDILEGLEGIEAFQFSTSDRTIYILWSNTVPQLVTIPALADPLMTDRDGNDLGIVPVQNGTVTFEVGLEPIFLEISK